MMKLTTMWRIDQTIDEAGRSPVADEVLAPWDHDPGSLSFFRSSANFVYAFRHRGQARFLRFADERERTRPTIEAEIALLQRLIETGLNVNIPIPSRHDHFVETVTTARGTFHAVVFTALPGDHLDIDDLDAPRFRHWGAALGRLHATTSRDHDPSLVARPSWRDHLTFIQEHIPADDPAVHAELNHVAATLGALPSSAATYGLIHFDFELDNLTWNDDAIGILDFDDCAHHWFAADIAFALRDLFPSPTAVDLAHPSLGAFVDGYTTHHHLPPASLAHLPLFLRLANLRAYARIARASDFPPSPDHPAWLNTLTTNFQNRLLTYPTSLPAPAPPQHSVLRPHPSEPTA